MSYTFRTFVSLLLIPHPTVILANFWIYGMYIQHGRFHFGSVLNTANLE
jgi:hypothetical protein